VCAAKAAQLHVVRRLRGSDGDRGRLAIPATRWPYRIVVARCAPKRAIPRGASRAHVQNRVVGGVAARRHCERSAQRGGGAQLNHVQQPRARVEGAQPGGTCARRVHVRPPRHERGQRWCSARRAT
jgi:hypothetical protein